VDARQRLYLRFVAEEVASGMRHRLVNKIAAVGALSFHLRRQLPVEGTPAAALAVLPMIDGELSQASQALDQRFVGPQGPAHTVSLARVAEGLLSSLDRPAGVELVGPAGPGATVSADPDELDLALHCLVENALEAVGAQGSVTVRFADVEPRGGLPMTALEVVDDGPAPSAQALVDARQVFFTTKPGRLGVGLNVAMRIAQRWRGTVELASGGRGAIARLSLPREPP
jgi:signal transduction histidine kinase